MKPKYLTRMKEDALDPRLGLLEASAGVSEKIFAGEDDVIVVVGLPVVARAVKLMAGLGVNTVRKRVL